MTKYFSQDTPLAGLERMMMSVPGFQKRGGGMMVLCRFHYKKEDVDCTYCRSYMRHTCQESVCPYIPERLEAGTIGYDWARYAAFIPCARMIVNSHLEQGISLRDLVTLGLPDHDVYLVHQTADVGFVPAADLATLTDQGKAQFAPLLDARVASIKQGAYGVEVALTGIEPELLTCFDQAVADSQRSTPALKYFM